MTRRRLFEDLLDDVDAVGNPDESAGDAPPMFVTEMFDEDEWNFTVIYAVNNFFSTIPPDDGKACTAAANALISPVIEIIKSVRFVDAISPVFAFGKSPVFSESGINGMPIIDICKKISTFHSESESYVPASEMRSGYCSPSIR